MAQREAMEREIAERSGRLTGPGGPGLRGNLLDAEGYPRSDIDLHAVATDRNRLAALMNDHKQLTARIERQMHQLHAEAREGGLLVESEAKRPRLEGACLPPSGAGSLVPFAIVDDVSADSPAKAAGIEVGDQLCAFGSVSADGNRGTVLTRLANALKENEGKEVATVFLRKGAVREMLLTPQRWGGPGLIGCHLRPLS
ncbi:unnamed protein product [Ostreobium quekettii]|uniref:PDZ domain-containing protein n=1 Tax=Ostreobium quekettii TaxID=121088 RepID=A0A8S1IYK0_9CHLO|nr:unnamed protein product [Ostreobium quekettii]